MPLSRAIMRERLRWLVHILRLKDVRFPKVFLFGQLSRAKRKAGRSWFGWEDVVRTNLKELETPWEGAKMKAGGGEACVAVLASSGLMRW